MNIRFDGKRALVTGAGKGIGRDLAKKLVECGAETYALSRTQSDLDSLQIECPGIHAVQCDLSDCTALKASVQSCGDIDLLVNNAAVALLEPFLEVKEEFFDKTFDINVKAPLMVSQIVARGMVDRKNGGSIVNISSQASTIGIENHTSYCMSKAALDQLTRNMSLELGPHNIRVNAVNPTVVNTEMGKVGWSDPAKANPMKKMIPLGRFAEVEDVVSVILFLLSDQAGMVTGSCLPIDGGCLGSLTIS
uniref:L-xylulose reductase n=2 Tax=Ciona savignyi TaxID=51511 RepID=H2ZQP2_CIOSA